MIKLGRNYKIMAVTAPFATPKEKKKTIASLEDILASSGAITQEQLQFVKDEVKRRQEDSEKIIASMNWVTDEQMSQAKSKVMGVPYSDPAEQPISPEILGYIPEEVAKRFQVIPINKNNEVLSVAMVDPLDLQVFEFIEKKSGLTVKPYLATAASISKAIAEQYTRGLSSEVTEALKEVAPGMGNTNIQSAMTGSVLGEATVARIVSTLLEYGIRVRASDIHIEPLENETRVRYRIDGILHEKLILPKKIHDSIISRIKILGNMKIDEKRVPQDARFNFKLGKEELDLRLSTLPTAFGEKFVMRLLKKTGAVPTLPELGLRAKALKNLEENIARPHGIILVTGPTGSGKTTTLYSVLSKLNSTKVNIVTLEDPIEYQMAGINQVQINPQAGLTFASGLRSFLRQDPNIIMVGEVRDSETTELAVQASLTGHLVFSTLHTNDASGALPRLLDMHAEPYLIASTVNCVVGQRVIRKICPTCKEAREPKVEIVEELKKILGNLYDFNTKKFKVYVGKGCSECNNTGYLGRIGIFEVLVVIEGISTVEEVLRVAEE